MYPEDPGIREGVRARMKRNLWIACGCLLLAAAILLGEAGWIPHGVKLFLLGLACALELWGVLVSCREKRGG